MEMIGEGNRCSEVHLKSFLIINGFFFLTLSVQKLLMELLMKVFLIQVPAAINGLKKRRVTIIWFKFKLF